MWQINYCKRRIEKRWVLILNLLTDEWFGLSGLLGISLNRKAFA
jgi:hypothetical protein